MTDHSIISISVELQNIKGTGKKYTLLHKDYGAACLPMDYYYYYCVSIDVLFGVRNKPCGNLQLDSIKTLTLRQRYILLYFTIEYAAYSSKDLRSLSNRLFYVRRTYL